MSLEEELAANTKALNRNSDLLEKGGTGGATAGKTAATTAGKTAAKTAAKSAPTVSAADMKAAVLRVKEECSEDDAKAIITKFAGKNKKLADLAALPDKFADVIAACEAALDGGEPADDADDDDGGI